MKELSIDQMEMITGGKIDCDAVAGFTVGLTIGLALGALAVSTGGLGLIVGAGLTGYFGTIGTLGCMMY